MPIPWCQDVVGEIQKKDWKEKLSWDILNSQRSSDQDEGKLHELALK